MDKQCSECGNQFTCDNDLTCWCTSFPKLEKKYIDEKDCLCKICLLKRYRKKLMKDDEVKTDLFDEEYRYQWKNRH